MEWEIYPKDGDGKEHTVVGAIRILRGVRSRELGNERDLLVYLPVSYHSSDRRYPVIYMHDGQNLFDRATSFGEEWGVDETMETLGGQGIEAIVVGIPNMGEDRCDEYSPFADPTKGGGSGEQYLDFLVGTIKPLVDRSFRTLSGRADTGMIGSSMGGLITLYAVLRRPEIFGFAGIMSPALWFADRAVFEYLEGVDKPAARLYVDVGTAEGEPTVADARRLRDALVGRGFEIGSDLEYVEDENAGHHEGEWGERFSEAVRFLLSGANLPSVPGKAGS